MGKLKEHGSGDAPQSIYRKGANSMATAVLYHDDADGFGAAYACWQGLSAHMTEVLFIPVQYGQPAPELPATIKSLFIVDFSYDRETCEALAERVEGNITILDHHKTAEAALDGLSFAVFDGSKSGAIMAWEWFFGNAPPPAILCYVQDRDLWQWKLPASREVNAYIATLPKDFEEWHMFSLDTALSAGAAIIAFQDKQISGAQRDVRMETISGHIVPVLNCTANVSEVGNELCKAYPDAPFSASYCDRADGKRSYSLRSIGNFDVSEIAKKYGGGGHRNAAGFTIEAPKAEL
jgi:oligoribonuclease NrnB/cAMP/cGMP phosphodiesterase (DHH superfamily)